MAQISSTIPNAIGMLETYMEAAAADNAALDVGVYVGLPTGSPKNNFFMVGDYQRGVMVTPNSFGWVTFPASAGRREETYSLQGCIRSWSGSTDPLGRLFDCYSMLDSLHAQIVADPGASGVLTPSGAWDSLIVDMEEAGPLEGRGWGVVLSFQLSTKGIYLVKE